MDNDIICRCCLSTFACKDVPTMAKIRADSIKYLEIIHECFNVKLAPSSKSSVCASCAKEVQGCLEFKNKVLKAEQGFIKKFSTEKCEEAKPIIKEEVTYDSTGDDSDDYFLSDTAKREVEIKAEEDDKKIKIKIKRIAATGNNTFKVQTSLCDTIKKYARVNKPDKTVIIRVGQQKRKAQNFRTEKQKHAHNLQMILEFSNVIIFKNKSLLGYQCGFCHLSFPDPADLRAHADSTHQKDRLLIKSTDLLENSTKVDVTDLRCNLCDDRIENLHLLKLHLTKIHGKLIYEDIKDHIIQFKLKLGEEYDCALCSSTYETFKMLTQHMNVHYSNYKCSECETSFATKRSLSAHKNIHIEGSYKCSQCDKVFLSKVKRQYHERIKHLGARNISNCAFCNEPFRSYYQRNQHMIKVHNSEAQYKCKICDKPYLLKSLLMCHIKKNHLMERNIQCNECGYKFFSNKSLKAHMVKHTGERKYSCSVCNKCYARKYTLKEHMRIHNNDRRFKCGICELSFVQKCSLKSHLLSNHGISMPASEITSTFIK